MPKPPASSPKPTKLYTPRQLPARWRKLLRCIPGYDPVATAADCLFDATGAQRALDFFPTFLVHVKGELAGTPLRLRRWQQAIVANLFGWLRPDGTRRYRRTYIEVGRKNGKSTLVAGLALYLLFCDREPGAEIYSAAADRKQAALVYDIAQSMLLANPQLRSRAKIYHSTHRILNNRLNAFYTPISAEAPTKHGFNSHAILFDEFHAQPNRELYDVLATSVGARRQPLSVYITTAGYDTTSVCSEEYRYACQIRDGVLTDLAYLPVIYEAAKDANWHHRRTWRAANPNLGVSVKTDFLVAEHQKATDTPSYENAFRRLYLDQWTEQADRWLSLDIWDRNATEIPLDELLGLPCHLALDLSTTRDLTCIAAIFDVPPHLCERFGLEPPRYSLHIWPFCPAANAHRREIRDRVPYQTWGRVGLLTLTEGDVIDYDAVRETIETIGDRHTIKQIAIDRWNAAQMTQQLQLQGFDVVSFGQGYASMSAPAKEFERLLVEGRLLHGGNPILRWAAANVAVEKDAAENIKPSKKRSIERIDPIVAAIMALGIRLVADPTQGRSVYEDRGPVVIG